MALLAALGLAACGTAPKQGTVATQTPPASTPPQSAPVQTPPVQTPPVQTPPVEPPPETPPVVVPPVTDPGQPGLADGSWGAPFVIASLPAVVSGDTATSPVSQAAAYSPCAPTVSEAGPELVYTFTAPGNGTITATLDDVSGDALDIDVQLMTAADATTCIARDNRTVTHAVTSGAAYFLSADTFASAAHAGAFTLTVSYAPAPVSSGICPPTSVLVHAPHGDVCLDLYEAPNEAGALPLVMYDLNESEAWCDARGKRLCFDDEWVYACGGEAGTTYPYGNTYDAAKCNTDKTWIAYKQSQLNAWPSTASTPSIADLQSLYENASPANGAIAVGEVQRLYQGEPSGSFAGCTNAIGAFDMVGSVEEWTRRRDGGEVVNGVHFSGNLKGRYWAEARTCFGGVTTHADAFRFYEIGFRCCQTP